MKNILNKIEFHYTFLIIGLGFVLTGYFNNLLVFTSLILVHELGHILFFKIYNIKVKKVIIYPTGGITQVDDILNRKIIEEILIASAGLIMQTMYFMVISILYNNGYIRENIYYLFKSYHYAMVILNVMPIYPLDGFKILNSLFNKVFNYKTSNRLSFFISVIFIGIVFIFGINNYSYLIVIGVLIENTYKYYCNLEYLYNKFLLERYLYDFNFSGIKIINNKNKLYKEHKHLIKIKDKYLKEKDFLHKIFDNT